MEHFKSVLNQPTTFDTSVLSEIPQWPTNTNLALPPSLHEVHRAIKSLSNGKAPGADCIPPEVYKYGGLPLAHRLERLFTLIWQEEAVPQECKDASAVHLYKKKGDRTSCDNHRGISLLSVAGKFLARTMLIRLSDHVASTGILPESRCGFRAGRSTIDVIFSLRQL